MARATTTHDRRNPDPWLALGLDTSTFFDQNAKEALVRNNRSWSRAVLLPMIRPCARSLIVVFRFIRLFLPNSFTSAALLHTTIRWGLKNFVSKDATYLIIRHFQMGSQVLRFFNDNLAEGTLPSHPLTPRGIEDFTDNIFVQHDLNIYNFIIDLNVYLRGHRKSIQPIEWSRIDFSAINDFDGDLKKLAETWHNVLDLQSAIELYTPLFALFLARDDFERSSTSLQLDETVAIYAAIMFGRDEIMGLVNNKHPMIPLPTLQAGFRLMLHGLDAENLYGFIKHVQRQVAAA